MATMCLDFVAEDFTPAEETQTPETPRDDAAEWAELETAADAPARVACTVGNRHTYTDAAALLDYLADAKERAEQHGRKARDAYYAAARAWNHKYARYRHVPCDKLPAHVPQPPEENEEEWRAADSVTATVKSITDSARYAPTPTFTHWCVNCGRLDSVTPSRAGRTDNSSREPNLFTAKERKLLVARPIVFRCAPYLLEEAPAVTTRAEESAVKQLARFRKLAASLGMTLEARQLR